MADNCIPAERLKAFTAQIFGHFGVPAKQAETVAGLMVEADLLGHETHGLFRLRQYINRLRDGGYNPAPAIQVLTETPAIALIDGDNGLGHLVMQRACDMAMEKASAMGIGWVGIRGGNHAGPAALYARPQAANGMIGICAAVGSANHVAPFGGTDLLLGTNPISIASPSGGPDPFVFDMATTVAAMGKIKTLAQRGEPMPEGWMVGKDGKPLTDPGKRGEGFLLPIGGPKGYGLSLAIGILAGVLNGAAFGSDVVEFSSDTTNPTNTGQFVAAINIEAFGAPEDFERNAKRAFDEMRASKPLPHHDPVRIPGDGRGGEREQRLADGVPLHAALHRELNTIAQELGMPSIDD